MRACPAIWLGIEKFSPFWPSLTLRNIHSENLGVIADSRVSLFGNAVLFYMPPRSATTHLILVPESDATIANHTSSGNG